MAFTFSTGEITLGATPKTILAVIAAATVPVRVLAIDVSPVGASATDPQIDVVMSHMDTDGTGTAVTGQKLNKNDGAFTTTAKKAYSVEPSNIATIWDFRVHKQGGLLYRPPRALVIRAAAAFGVVCAVSAGSDPVIITITAEEV